MSRTMPTQCEHGEIVEEWRPCPDFEEVYEVSNRGRVRRTAVAQGTAGGIISDWLNWGQYPTVSLYLYSKRSNRTVHRLVATAFIGPPEGAVRLEVNHRDSNRQHPCAENLEWVTRSENIRHAIAAGARTRGGRI